MCKPIVNHSSLKSAYLFKHFSAVIHPLSGSATCNLGQCSNLEFKSIAKTLEILGFVTPNKLRKVRKNEHHYRLIESCLHDLKDGGQKHSNFIDSNDGAEQVAPVEFIYPNDIFDDFFAYWVSNNSKMDDPILSFVALNRKGIVPNESSLSYLLSSCGSLNFLGEGVQLHALAVKIGLSKCSSIGIALIGLYSKCQQMKSADQVFLRMPIKNTISWTAIISCHAQHCHYEACMNLFNLMRKSCSKPNDVTCAILLSICRSSASLALGRSFHCLEFRMGFNSFIHVLNALISMYAKCGGIEEARNVFNNMLYKDQISWNSMIFGYSQFGFAKEAICLLKEMDEQMVAPDKISFLGVLSSCRHAGLVQDGLDCFNSMIKRGIKPVIDHYSCIVDLLGRAGMLEEALDFIQKMSVAPCGVIWGSLLSSCRHNGNVWIGILAAENRLLFDPGCAGTHQQLANLYASAGCWDQVARVRKQMKEKGVKPNPGCSWIEIADKVYSFKCEDGLNNRVNEILDIVVSLSDHMQAFD